MLIYMYSLIYNKCPVNNITQIYVRLETQWKTIRIVGRTHTRFELRISPSASNFALEN